jgi:hypothetical protein
MKFRLTYTGPLLASSNNSTRPKEKWDIRKQLHPQLEELWSTHPVLCGHGIQAFAHVSERDPFEIQPVGRGAPKPHPVTFGTTTSSSLVFSYANSLAKRASANRSFQFCPLVQAHFGLVCALDITFMRKEEPGSLILQGGDLDNRIKTLFDGLKVPSQDDMKAGSPDGDPDQIFFCLLEQDSLITDFNVRTDRLLTKGSVHDVHLVIEVTVRVVKVTMENIGFIGD